MIRHLEHRAGDMLVRYELDEDAKRIGLSILPWAQRSAVARRRADIKAEPEIAPLVKQFGWPFLAWAVEPLVQLHLRGDVHVAAFAQGRTMQAGASSQALAFVGQRVLRRRNRTTVRTTLRHPSGVAVAHDLSWGAGEPWLTACTTVTNRGTEPATLDLLTSAALGGISPFAVDDAPGRLRLHRFRSTWSAEGRHEDIALEDLALERSWAGYGIACERFGQVGSMPVRGYHPTAAIEDRGAGVTWGLRLQAAGSWQIELMRRDDRVNLAGGLADRELGHWSRTLAPGEAFTAPEAVLSVCAGGVDDICARLTASQLPPLRGQPQVERDLPVLFNEWCTSWGNPRHDDLIVLGKRLGEAGITTLVIDDGWAARPSGAFQQNGDWVVDAAKFPQGIGATSRALARHGVRTGIWFEFEVCNAGSQAWERTDLHLHRDGQVLQVGNRRFWNFRKPEVHALLAEKVIGRLKADRISYLKVDYNDTIGVGIDGPESPGENLRQHLDGVQAFFRRIRRELPGLVIEICSSGGHRLEPSWLAIGAMGRFSDAHEGREIPLIAANNLRLMPAAQNQVWAVLRAEDDDHRLVYSLAAGFLGRLVISGEVAALAPGQWARAVEAVALQRRCAPIIAANASRRIGAWSPSWRHLTGWQAVTFTAGRQAMIVVHGFADAPASVTVPLAGAWRIDGTLTSSANPRVTRQGVVVPLGSLRAAVVLLRR